MIEIRDLLGHQSVQTTQRYIKLKKKDLLKVKNPLEDCYNPEKPKILDQSEVTILESI